jgi:hypothetical protein
MCPQLEHPEQPVSELDARLLGLAQSAQPTGERAQLLNERGGLNKGSQCGQSATQQ